MAALMRIPQTHLHPERLCVASASLRLALLFIQRIEKLVENGGSDGLYLHGRIGHLVLLQVLCSRCLPPLSAK